MQLKVGCSHCVDLSPLALCNNIVFQYCDTLTDKDISALGKQVSLDLSGCRGITDVSHLNRVKYLFLNHCTGIKKGWGCLSDVSSLNVSYCVQLTDDDTVTFGTIHDLTLSFTNITRVGHLRNVSILNIRGCCFVTDVSS